MVKIATLVGAHASLAPLREAIKHMNRYSALIRNRFVIFPAGALAVFGGAAGVQAQNTACVVTDVVTCSQDQSAGIQDGQNHVVSTMDLVVNDLTTDITPDATLTYPGISHGLTGTSTLSQIKVTSDLGTYSILATGIGILMAGSENEDLEQVILSHSGAINTTGASHHGIYTYSNNAAVSGQPAGADFQLGVEGSITTDTTATNAVGLFIEGVGGDGAANKAGGAGPTFLTAGALYTTNPMTITTYGQGSGTSGTYTAGAHGLYVIGRGGDGGEGADKTSSGTADTGGAGGNAAGTGDPWIIGGADKHTSSTDEVGGRWTITTAGDYSNAVRIEAHGGDGSKGSHNSDVLSGSGGTGGAGGDGADMQLFYNNPTPPQVLGTTNGDYSPALWVLSQGGNGGTGGGGLSGGNGGHGGAGGSMSLGEDGRQIYLHTTGDYSPGFFLYSQAGGGGKGTDGSTNSGGSGGHGGTAGTIATYLLTGATTSGAYSAGFAAYSTGGAGNTGGSGGWEPFDNSSGSGGNSADGGVIDLVHWNGSIVTTGPGSEGLIAQSIGGHASAGGGCEGVLVCFGANGGSAGSGSTVQVTNSATITTYAEESVGLMAQSHGGGGGNGGSAFAPFYSSGGKGGAGGAGGPVIVTNTAELITAGNDATGLYAQSIGGSGGDGGATVAMDSFGGNGGATSVGGPVTVTNSGVINAGDASLAPGGVPLVGTDPTCGTGCSHGIFAQSVGGGGGNAGSSYGTFSVGGSGGDGGDGGTTTVSNTANITTSLDQSKGILAHSVGGGGGAGGGAVSVSVGVAVALGGSGGEGGDGKQVVVSSSGAAIQTAGTSSHAISAQSIGGGGGHGGFAISLAVGTEDVPAGAISVGGTGGDGGSADTVTVNLPDPSYTGVVPSSLTTTGDSAHGVVAQSIGGGGGDGGFAIAVAGSAGMSSGAFAIGGKGSKAGNGAAVAINSDAAVMASGDNSIGLYAQSVGGGGGHGGFAVSGAINFSDTGAVALAFGGSGGGGGTSSTVGVTNSGTIAMAGDTAPAILAQSVAGGGGNGGLTLAATATTSLSADDPNDGAALSFGASGGNGGTAGAVEVTNTGALTTTGNMSAGIIAQSVGGGGGNGSMSLSGAVSGPDALSASVSHGGSGGEGSDGGSVRVTNTGAITTGNMDDPGDADTTTNNAHGILAQSIGGGGGNGGLAGAIALGVGGESQTYNVAVALGGSGKSGGESLSVVVVNNLDPAGGGLTTYSEQSHGIFAQSVGGGGGNGGSGVAGTIEVGASMQSSTVNSSISVGGSASGGSTGGNVTVSSYSPITTYGTASHGIFAQGIGGGGGAGGSVKTLTYNLECVDSSGDGTACDSDDETDGTNYNVNIGVGGTGGGGGEGGQVSVVSQGDITTTGDGATAIYAQSIGGGGGDGGDASGVNTGALAKENRSKNTDTLTLYVGGSGGSAGDGDQVTLGGNNTNGVAAPISGTLKTQGANSPGIFVQSIGGGGGKGGTGMTSTSSSSTFTFGGDGNAAGDGGTILAFLGDLNITTGTASTGTGTDENTLPDSSYGIFLQSVGGGGGAAGNPCLAGKCSTGNTGEDIAIGVARSMFESGGGAGNGGTIYLVPAASGTTANITTYADNAIGIFAQSVGGGGGTAGSTQITLADGLGGSIWGSVGGDGVGGIVEVQHVGEIYTSGDGATGIFVQSAGGNASGGGGVTLLVDGKVIVGGADASGIIAQSVKLNSDNDPVGAGSSAITVAASSIVSGGTAGSVQAGAGIEIHDGVGNTVINDGTITSLSDIAIVSIGSGSCSVSGTGNVPAGNCQTAVTNNGLIDGDLVLTGPGSSVANNRGGRINTHSSTRIASGGTLQNDGEISIWGDAVFGKTQLDARIAQGATGTLRYDLAHPSGVGEVPQHDQLELTGSAALEGTVQVNIRDVGIGGLGRQSITLIETDGGLTADMLEVVQSAVAKYQLQYDTNDLSLSYDIDFFNPAVKSGLSKNQAAVARHLAAMHDRAEISSDLLYLTEAVNEQDYEAALDAMSPASYGVNGSAALLSSLQFSDSLMSCKERSGEYRFIREDSCFRLDIAGGTYAQSSSSDTPGYSLDWGGISIGGQKTVDSEWTLGAALAFGSFNGSSDEDYWSSDGDQFQIGGVAKYQSGPYLFAGSISAGFGDVDVRRNVAPGLVADGTQDVRYLAGQFRAARLFEHGHGYFTPRVDLNATYVDTSDVTERGAGSANLDVQGSSKVYWSLRPAIEFGTEIALASGYLVRPRAVIGITQYLNDPSQNVSASLANAGNGVGSFTVDNEMDRTFLDIELGVDVFSKQNMTFSVNGFAQFSENSESYGGALRLAWLF